MHLLEVFSWEAFRDLCFTGKGLSVQFTEDATCYDLYGPDANGLTWHIKLRKSDEAGEFVSTYKALCNKKIVQIDSDGAPMSRVKVAPSGWNFNLRGVEFSTSTLDSVVNKDAANADVADVVIKLYKADGTLITDQGVADADCVKTQVDIEPPYDIYISGGKLKFITQPTVDVRVGVIGVPDIPAAYGGSKHFIQNVNLRFLAASEGVNADGRAAKWLQYSATNHTNKIRFILYHPAGHKMPIEVLQETYRQ